MPERCPRCQRDGGRPRPTGHRTHIARQAAPAQRWNERIDTELDQHTAGGFGDLIFGHLRPVEDQPPKTAMAAGAHPWRHGRRGLHLRSRRLPRLRLGKSRRYAPEHSRQDETIKP